MSWHKSALLVVALCSISIISHASELQQKSLPPTDNNQPVVVNIGLYMLDIISVDQPNQILTARVEITSVWVDERLSFESEDGLNKIYTKNDVNEQLNAMWTPDLEVVNQAGSMSVENSNLKIFPDGKVVHRSKVILDVATKFDYTRFPFDEQELVIEIESFTYHSDQVIFKVLEQVTGIANSFRSDEWLAYPMRVYAGYRVTRGLYNQDWSYVNFQMKLERRTLFYFLRIIMPYCFFILLSTCVFWMQRENLDRRVSIIVTFALTSVAFNFLVLQYLPNVPYRTMINTIIGSGYFSAGFIIILVISLQMFKYHGYRRVWYYGNVIFRFVAPIGFLFMWFLIYFNFMRKELQIVYFIN